MPDRAKNKEKAASWGYRTPRNQITPPSVHYTTLATAIKFHETLAYLLTIARIRARAHASFYWYCRGRNIEVKDVHRNTHGGARVRNINYAGNVTLYRCAG